MRIAQIGNFGPEFSTENEILHALQVLDHDVVCYQEEIAEGWDALIAELRNGSHFDAIIWTSTKSLNDEVPFDWQWRMLHLAQRAGVPTIAVHLDRWWGLDRSDQLFRPFFACQHVYTADGGNQARFADLRINHRWMPPAISERWCQPGTPNPEYECDVVFVGGWHDYGHREWRHRPELIDFLSRTYDDGFLALPRRNRPAIRGLELNDVYWSAKVVVGDSCLVPKADGTPMTHYCSDRVPETLGRGGVLVHPYVEGLDEHFTYNSWRLGDWRALRMLIDKLLDEDEMRTRFRKHAISETLSRNTYTHRMRGILNEVIPEG